MAQHGPADTQPSPESAVPQQDIADAVSRIFSDLKRDMDSIVASATSLPSDKATGSHAQMQRQDEAENPMVRLSHGRTECEDAGYDDYELPSPLGLLPEALDTDEATTAPVPPAAAPPVPSASAMSARQQLQDELQDACTKAELLLASPAGLPARASSGADGDAGGSSPQRESGDSSGSKRASLSYTQLLDRALSGPAKAQGGGARRSSSSSMRVSAEPCSSTGLKADAAGATTSSSSRSRPVPSTAVASSGQVPVCSPDSPAAVHSSPPQQLAQSKFPASPTHRKPSKHGSSHFSVSAQPRAAWCSAAAGGKVFNALAAGSLQAGSTCRTGNGQAEASPDKPKVTMRSRSAPREQDAAQRHVQRMNASPTRSSMASRDSILSGRASWRAQGRQGRVSSSLEDWRRPSSGQSQQQGGAQRLPGDGFRTRPLSASPGRADRLAALGPEFFRRQEALLARRAELMAQRRTSADEDLSECTFQPRINPSSRNLLRSVELLHAWEARRKLTVFAKALDKCEQECEGYTFTPKIDPLSRQLVLASYAAAPDPARPWAASPSSSPSPAAVSPRRSSPSPDAMRMLRETLPPPNILCMAGPTAQQKAQAVLELLESTGTATAASSRQHTRSSLSPVPAAWEEGGWQRGEGLLSPNRYQAQQQQQQQWQQQQQPVADSIICVVDSGDSAAAAPLAYQQPAPVAAAAAQDFDAASALQQPIEVQLPTGVVLGVPVMTPATAVPVDASDPSAEVATADAAFDKAPAAGQVAKADPVLELQLLLTALKLSPVQAQQGLEEGKPRISSSGRQPAAAAAAATAASAAGEASRDSSSGGMAPGTPLFGTLGGAAPAADGTKGSGTTGNAAAAAAAAAEAALLKASGGRMRDVSAGGMHAAGLAKKDSAGAGSLPGTTAAAAATWGKPAGSSPLSKPQQQQQQQRAGQLATSASAKAAAAGKDASLQELLQHADYAASKLGVPLHAQTGLQTVPAFFYTSAQHNAAEGVPQAKGTGQLPELAKQRPSSYSQKYQKRVSQQGLSQQDVAAALQPPPELHEVLGSLAADDAGSTAADCSMREPPTYADLRRRWLVNQGADSVEGSGSGGVFDSSTGVSAAGSAAAAGGGSGVASLNSSLVPGPDTPLYHRQQGSPFTAAGAGLLKQYSAAQVLNERARHSSPGARGSCGGLAQAAPEAEYAAHAHAASKGEAAEEAAAAAGGAAMVVPSLLLFSSSHNAAVTADMLSVAASEASRGMVSSSSNGSPQACQPLAACSSVVSVPELAAGGLLPGAAGSSNGSHGALVSHKVEVLLEGTRSSPFELVLSPRSSKVQLAASVTPGPGSSPGVTPGPTCIDLNSPLGQQLLQLVLASRAAEGGLGEADWPATVTVPLAQWQQLQQQLEQQQQQHQRVVALQQADQAPVPLVVPAIGVPAVGVPVLPRRSTVKAVARALDGASPTTVPCSPAFTSPAEATAAHAQGATTLAAAAPTAASGSPPLSHSSSSSSSMRQGFGGQAQQQQQQGQVSEGGADLAADLAELLQRASSLSPEEKADRVVRTFAKTISRLNMGSDVLQQTMAALGPAAVAATAPAPDASSMRQGQAVGPAAVAPAAVTPAPAAVTPAAEAAAVAVAASAQHSGLGLSELGLLEGCSEADSMQQLLEHVRASGLLMHDPGCGPRPAAAAAPGAMQAAGAFPMDAVAAAGPAGAAAVVTISASPGSPTSKSWAIVAASHPVHSP